MFDRFAKEKSDFLKKKDKSKKGYVDKGIKEIVDKINFKKDYYTTSSCAGRIVLLEMRSRKKNECSWIFTKHDKVNYNKIKNSLKNYNNKNKKIKSKYIGEASDVEGQRSRAVSCERVIRSLAFHKSAEGKLNDNFNIHQIKNQVWFKQQPIILHVACRNIEAAKNLLDAARKVFKHSGIISVTNRKITVEIIGNEKIETIVADKDFVADEKYLKNIVKYANKNFVESKKKNDKFFEIIRDNL